jgi:hypothetical protein
MPMRWQFREMTQVTFDGQVFDLKSQVPALSRLATSSTRQTSPKKFNRRAVTRPRHKFLQHLGFDPAYGGRWQPGNSGRNGCTTPVWPEP